MTGTTDEATEIRRIVLRQSRRANVGHIGSCLCVADILAAVYGRLLRARDARDPDRDRFILSKGHAGLAFYAALALRGWIAESNLDTFCSDGGCFGVHPEAGVPGIDFAAGSLGHGLSMACGAALAARLAGSDRRVYCLLSDGECNEGSTWEAAMFASHHELKNLIAIVDCNGQQAFGATAEVMRDPNPAARWRSFGWDVKEADGHSIDELEAACRTGEGPRVVIARTTFGKGVSYMESGTPLTQTHLKRQRVNWHYLPMSADEFAIAMQELA